MKNQTPKMDPERKLRVLLIAEAANPEWTSVPLVGWNLSRALLKHADVHLVTQIRNRDALLRHGLIEGQDFTAIDNEYIASRLIALAAKLRGGVGKGWTTISAFSVLSYYSFEQELWKLFEKQLVAREFDLVHRITPLSPTNPSLIANRLARLSIPFVLGPLNGGVPWPKGFTHRQHAEHEWLSHVRGLYKLMPGYRSTRRKCAAIIVGSKFTQQEMPRWALGKCIYIPENAVDLELFNSPRISQKASPIQAAFVGRLVPYKGADIAIEAAVQFLRAGSLQLQIIGDGPQKDFLIAKVKKLGVERSVQFHGWLSQQEVQKRLSACDFLVFPSIREFGGGVVLEAMALGVTPIVADYGGPSELVDEATGIRVPFVDETSLVEGFRRAMQAIISAPDTLNRLGSAARQKVVEEFTWEAKARKISSIYHSVVSKF
ncbi:glycosyltransferase involved in cell wall biosynthesis [Bradyrhizobium sp. AZCC 1610]|uniref:glycosyltransferase family 4 protein n=1 Tax=Bradyrhizobium sp. AZCC 1610 TaxID=3117020 RepID=UPI002FEEDD85